MRHIPALALIAALLLIAAPPAAAQGEPVCFSETGQCVAGPVLAWWRASGGLPTVGMPLTPLREEPVEGRPAQVQWFERARAELAADGSVRLGRVGADLLAAQGRDWRAFPASEPQPDCLSFPQTGHQLCGPLLRTWTAAGGLATLGLPLSGPRTEQLADGHLYTVQWLERGRLELHPGLPPPYDVQLGRVAAELLAAQPAPLGLTATAGQLAFESTAGLDRELFPQADPARASYINVISAAGAERAALTRSHAQRDEAPAWSPDGSKIAFHSPRAGGLPDIYVMDADGANLRRLTNSAAADGFPAWSPDGSRIAFASERDGNWEIYVMAADGSGLTNLSRNPGATDTEPAWSSDGSKIAFRSTVFGHDDEILVMAADGSGQVNLSRKPASDESAPAWSPDSSKLAFESNRDGNREVYVMHADGSRQTDLSRSPAGDYAPAWSPDGTMIAFESDRDGNREVYLMRADGSGQANLSRSPRSDERQPGWAPAPPAAAGPCADVPEPVSARVAPSRCPRVGETVTAHVFGFLAGSRFEYRATGPDGARSPPLTGGHVDERGELAGIQFPAGSLTPGRWRCDFTFLGPNDQPIYSASVDLRVVP
jgi:hypothetical protein